MNKSLRPILVVDDSPQDRELIKHALQKFRVANPVVSVGDGTEAMDYLNRAGPWADREPVQPVVIMLDIKLPKMDGHEVLRRIRADEQLTCIPVVMLTSSREESDLLASYKLRANAFVVKPLDFSDFQQVTGQLGVFWGMVNQTP